MRNHGVVNNRVSRERSYHDARYSTELERSDLESLLVSQNGYLDVNLRHIFDYIGLETLAGQMVLEIGSGSGYATALVAKKTHVVASDVSMQALRLALARATANRVFERVRPVLLLGEQLPFEDEAFDVVYGVGVLHHLSLWQASREIWRVLKPGGRLAFVEPLGHNPVLNLARNLFSSHTPDEIMLTYQDIQQFCQPFSHFEIREYMFLSMLRLAISWERLVKILERLDLVVLTHLPFLRRYCRTVAVLATR
jgi:SAM-dependent methyltransferase